MTKSPTTLIRSVFLMGSVITSLKIFVIFINFGKGIIYFLQMILFTFSRIQSRNPEKQTGAWEIACSQKLAERGGGGEHALSPQWC